MAKNNRPQNQQEQKVVTKYDKKVQKRKEAQRKAERDKKIAVFACIAAAAKEKRIKVKKQEGENSGRSV